MKENINPLIIVALISMLISQTTKLIIEFIIYHRFDMKRLNGDGGMPSSHSFIVSSVTTLSFLLYHSDSTIFAMSLIFAIITCHDAMHSRYEIGKQARIINNILNNLNNKEQSEKMLQEFVGHTPFQVLIGVVLGIITAILYYNFLINI